MDTFWGIWCQRNEIGFWRDASEFDGPLQTTETDAKRRATALNEYAAEHKTGWACGARPYQKTPVCSGCLIGFPLGTGLHTLRAPACRHAQGGSGGA